MSIQLKVKGIGISKYKLKKFALIAFYILGYNYNRTEVYIYVKYKLYLIKGLKANILISNNIPCIKDFSINLAIVFIHI